jgi:hypothetical protein
MFAAPFPSSFNQIGSSSEQQADLQRFPQAVDESQKPLFCRLKTNPDRARENRADIARHQSSLVW